MQALGVVHLQSRQHNFDAKAHFLATITLEKLHIAQKQEERGETISDLAVCTLISNIYAAVGKVMGLNANKFHLKSQIWSTLMLKKPPTLWATINPDDLHNPVAQIFAHEKIDSDCLLKKPLALTSNRRHET